MYLTTHKLYGISSAVLAAVVFAAGISRADEGDPLSQGKYKNSMRIAVSGYSGSALANFPLLVVLGTSRTGFLYNQFKVADAGDLRFANAAGLELAYEVEEWNTSGNSYVWVKVPSLSSGGYITAFWGNAAVSAPAYRTDGSVWDSNFVGVWHMDEVNAGDSTAYANNGTGTGNTTTKGIAGDCQDFGGTAYVTIDSVADDVTGDITISTLVNTASGRGSSSDVGDGHTFIGVSQNLGGGFGLGLFSVGAGFLPGTVAGEPCTFGKSAGVFALGGHAGSGSTVHDATWHHVAFTRTGSTAQLYVDGVALGSTFSAAFALANNHFWSIGRTTDFGANKYVTLAKIDEVRISRAARTANWMKASWDCIGNHESFLTYDAVAITPEAGSVFFGW